jgi:eukaryotic-like serine/threonine-protein kinase
MQQFILNKRYSLVKNKQNAYQCLLCDNDSNEYFTLNDTIFDFLKLFKTPISLKDVAKKVVKKENLSLEETIPILQSFIDDMLGKGIIISFGRETTTNNKVLTAENTIDSYLTDKFDIVKKIATNTSIKIFLGTPKGVTAVMYKVIIKVLTAPKEKDTLKTFLKEFKILAKFSHPNIISLIEMGDNYGVVEYFEGKSLSKVVVRAIPMDTRILIIQQLLSAFAYLHKRNYLHGDLHPSNILVDKQFNVKIIDFDLATRVGNNTSRFGGIREFLAPEIISNDMFDFVGYRPTKRSEVYQLGIMIYFILYGRFPIEKDTWKQHLEALHTNQIEFATENQFQQKVDNNFITILQQCLSFFPQNRFTSALKIQKFIENSQ